MINQEKEDLASLEGNPGWIRVRRWIEEEFFARCVEDLERAYDMTDSVERDRRILQIFAGKRTARTILEWPSKRVIQLKANEQAATPAVTDTGFQRGGYRA